MLVEILESHDCHLGASIDQKYNVTFRIPRPISPSEEHPGAFRELPREFELRVFHANPSILPPPKVDRHALAALN